MIPGMGGGLTANVGGGGPSSAESGNQFDSSWNINFGGGSIATSRNEPLGGIAAQASPYMAYVLVAAGLLIAWRMTRR